MSNLKRIPPCADVASFVALFCDPKPEPFPIPVYPYGLSEAETPKGEGVIYRGSARRVDICYDFEDCYFTSKLLPPGFREIEEFSNGYRSVWCNDSLRTMITYCEGDISVTIDPDDTLYAGRMASAVEFYRRAA